MEEDLTSQLLSLPYVPTPRRPSPRIKQSPSSSLKSNLTASFLAIKSAARSFSNFTAPSIPSDDLLTRSLFTPRYPPEMRPKGFNGVPDPATRRYLNPSGPPALDFSAQFREALSGPEAEDKGTPSPMIQMRTYSRTTTARSRRRAPSSSSSAASANPFERPEFPAPGSVPDSPPTTRQREPRENSDFLRVIVLEMNMRREGKLDAKAGGRARVWLPPRKGDNVAVVVVGENGARVPGRWVGVTAEEL